MFDKLKLTHTYAALPGINRLISYGALHYDYIADGPHTAAFNVIPEEYRKDFKLLQMMIDTMVYSKVPAHTDSYILSTINFYITTASSVTEFYKVDQDKLKTSKGPNQTTGDVFDSSCITPAGSFLAKPGEAWLLDVTVPHSVTSFNKRENRVAIALQSHIHSYARVKEFLQETGNL